MSGVGILGAIVIGIFAGWLAERVMNRHHGILTNLVVGLIGSVIGGFIANAVGVGGYGWIGSIIASTLGAVILLFVLGLFRRPN